MSHSEEQNFRKSELMTRGDKNHFNTFRCHEAKIDAADLSQLYLCCEESVFQLNTKNVAEDEFGPTFVTSTTQISIFKGFTSETLHSSRMSSEPIPRDSIQYQPMMFLFDPVAKQAKIARLYQNGNDTSNKYYFRSDDV